MCDDISGRVETLETKEEAGAKVSSPPQPDTKLGMSFNFGKLPGLYGEATCAGVVPLLLPLNKFPTPGIIRDPSLMTALLTKWMPEYRELWPNLLDEEVEARLRDYIIMASFLYPTADLRDPRYQPFVSLISHAFSVDDIFDDADFAGSLTYQDAKSISRFLSDLFSGKYTSLDQLPNPMAVFRRINAHNWAFYVACRDNIPRFHETWNEHVRRGMTSMVEANGLLMECSGFSGTTKAYFRAIESGGAGFAEFTALVFGLEIPEGIRHDLLFEQLMWHLAAATDLLNDIFGLGRDIRLGQLNDSSILSAVVDKGQGFQQAFDNTLEESCDHINDIRVAVAKLRGLYSTHEDLLTFLHLMEMYVDGQLRFYAEVGRYKLAGLQIVEMKNKK